SELDIAAATDSTVVVLVPESGDGIQAMKAGLMEAADLFVTNKSDRPGADKVAREISMMLHLRTGAGMRNLPAHHGVDLTRLKKAPAPPAVPAVPDPQPAGPHPDPHPAGSHPHPQPPVWEIPVLKTIAEKAGGVPELAGSLDAHRAWLTETGEL